MAEKDKEPLENKSVDESQTTIKENIENENLTEKTSSNDKLTENNEIEKLKSENSSLKDDYVRLLAEFENYKKRSFKEKMEIIQTAGKDIMIGLLEIIDDVERAEKQFETTNDLKSLKEGINLIFNKLKNNLTAKGLKSFDSLGLDFNEEQHDAVAVVPAASKDIENKIVDVLEKGYSLNDKIIRHAKVVVAKTNE